MKQTLLFLSKGNLYIIPIDIYTFKYASPARVLYIYFEEHDAKMGKVAMATHAVTVRSECELFYVNYSSGNGAFK